jgi:rod shape-determining protein MreD
MKHAQITLLRPINTHFMLFSILCAVIYELVPRFNHLIWAPDILSLVILFWVVRDPYRINIGIAYILGLIMDVRYGTFLGEKAIEYAALAFSAHALHARLRYFSFSMQSLHFLPILIIIRGLNLLMHYNPEQNISWLYWLKPIIECVIWPLLANILLIPQKMPHNDDPTRPI